MDEIYRFRPIDSLFGDFRELERQTIYFAESSKLNDPMEAVRDLVWSGDAITWMNLFRHYLNCLHHIYFLMHTSETDVPVGPAAIPINMRWDDLPNKRYADLVSEIVGDVRKQLDLVDLASRLTGLGRAVRSDELEFFLTFLHAQALVAIHKSYIERGLQDPNTAITDQPWLLSTQLPRLFELLEELKTDGVFIEARFEMMQQFMIERRLETKITMRSELEGTMLQNLGFVFSDFPHAYVQRLSLAVGPTWYAACYAESYGNSALWGNYAQGHRGVCLVFAVDADEHGPGLDLHKRAARDHNGEDAACRSHSPRRFYFKQVRYVQALEEVDFFARISGLPESSARAVWFTDDDGNMSPVAAHMAPDADIDAWQDALWSEYLRDICTKTKEWEFEGEHRLVSASLLADTQSDEELTLSYDFSALKGIIFGINTGDDDKIAIIDLIRGKCEAAGRAEFDFRQAYYSWRTGQIESYPLKLDVTR